ncbi:unnamed protein product [Coffea canephora]|uniref:AAA+ ATPase domain-containing protein n=1 Tax=Coffea canephora TaxID=49390 RepID=A0A068VA09_COFCA|nr:unnamed protein product [Coffea canephora]
MADAALSATIQVALQTVVSLAGDHVNLVREFPEELERLNESAEMIRGFLVGADGKMHSPGVQIWLRRLEEEVFKAGNVLDDLNYENLRRKVKYQNQPMKKKVLFCFSFFNKIGFRWRLGSMIRDINTNLERIHGHARGLGLPDKRQVEEAFPTGATASRQTDSKIVRSDVLGRKEDESKIVKLLTESESDSISVISITGPPGLGKTTLTKAVFNTPQFDNHFDKKIWVCVAKEVEIMELFKMILESSTRKKAEVDSREVIVEGIETELKEKRYLLVLDDLWNHQEGLLNDFFTTLEALKPKKGSWCLVTSRLQEVAIVLSRHRRINFTRHDLRKLYDDDCWSIVKNWANVGEEVPEDIREQVLRRCDGLPLAATLIGGLFSQKRKEDWPSILEESLLTGDQVELWMAEGFLQPDSQNQTMEGIGYEYLRTLLQTSLLEEVKEGGTWYKMHDLVHDFAKSILNHNSSNQDRYLAVYSSERINEKTSASLRTLFWKGGMADDMLSKFKYLHVLKLFGEDVTELPNSIGTLKHLHLLDVSDSMIRTLPESLCKLYRLQTLRIGKLEEGFPKKMSNLISMRHLHYYYHAVREIQMPSSIGRWTCLQTLEFFNIGRQEEGRGIQELGTLQDLKGSLEIRNLELVNGKDDAELANLSRKPNLYRLVFEWGNRDQESDKCDEDVLEGLQPHPNLKELHIRNFRGDRIPQWLVKSSALVELHLINCTELALPTLGQLPSLQNLYLCGLENTLCIGLSFYGTIRRQTFFPALKILSLESMKSLEEWKDAHVFPVLEKLHIRDCPRLTTIPTPSRFPSLDVLEIEENCHVLLRLCHCPTLQSVELDDCPNITTLRGMSCAACLKKLVVEGCENLRELPEDLYQFQALEHLEIWGCPRIDSFGSNPNNGQKSLLKSLEVFCIGKCNGLTRLPVEMFDPCMSLRRLTLFDCPNLVSFPLDLRRTPSLETFWLERCPKLITELPSGFGYLTSLRDLQDLTNIAFLFLRGFGAIEALPDWLGNLASLEELILFLCEKLEYLPSMAAMERLKLRRLQIKACPLLTGRCTPQTGSEWPKISNIPHRDIS